MNSQRNDKHLIHAYRNVGKTYFRTPTKTINTNLKRTTCPTIHASTYCANIYDLNTSKQIYTKWNVCALKFQFQISNYLPIMRRKASRMNTNALINMGNLGLGLKAWKKEIRNWKGSVTDTHWINNLSVSNLKTDFIENKEIYINLSSIISLKIKVFKNPVRFKTY